MQIYFPIESHIMIIIVSGSRETKKTQKQFNCERARSA